MGIDIAVLYPLNNNIYYIIMQQNIGDFLTKITIRAIDYGYFFVDFYYFSIGS